MPFSCRVLLATRFVWTRVLESVLGLPGCPPDMTEPQYASLVFEPFNGCVRRVKASELQGFISLCVYGFVRLVTVEIFGG